MKLRLPSHLTILFTVILVDRRLLPWARSKTSTNLPYTVTSFPEVEELYLNLRNPEPIAVSRLTRALKWKICRKVFFASIPHWNQFTGQTSQLLVRPTHTRYTLMRDHRRIFDELFESTAFDRCPRWRRQYRYKNRSAVRKIFVRGNEYPENVFACLVKNVRHEVALGTEIEQYYVSDGEYNVNERPGGEYIGGRFLFSRDHRDRIVVHALVEENAYPALTEAAQKRYRRKRNAGHGPALEAEHDPLCQLNESRRLRLCNSVTLSLRGHLPGNVQVGGECVKKSFVLRNSRRRRELTTASFDEWMILCAWTFNAGRSRLEHYHYKYRYFVSRSYSDNEVFVFEASGRPERETLRLIECKKKISVVSDTPVRFRFDDVED